ADRDRRAAKAELGFGEQSHGRTAGSPGLAVGSFVGFRGDLVVANVDLTAVVEITACGRRGFGLLCETHSSKGEQAEDDDEASAEHGRPPMGQECSAEMGAGEEEFDSRFLGRKHRGGSFWAGSLPGGCGFPPGQGPSAALSQPRRRPSHNELQGIVRCWSSVMYSGG